MRLVKPGFEILTSLGFNGSCVLLLYVFPIVHRRPVPVGMLPDLELDHCKVGNVHQVFQIAGFLVRAGSGDQPPDIVVAVAPGSLLIR